MRICLIVAILAGAAAVGLNFVKVKEKVVNLATDRDNEKRMKEEKIAELNTTRKELNATTTKLKQTETELTSTKEDLTKAVADAADKTKRLERTTEERDKARKERDDSQAELAAYKATDLKPEQIIAIRNQFKGLQKDLEALMDENKGLGRKIVTLTNELARYTIQDYTGPALPPSLRGKVLVTDPKWNFVVLNVGQEQGVLEYGELLVNRNGKLVAKVKIRSVQKDRSIANVMPGWQLGEVMEGDQVIPAHPSSS